MSTEILQRLHGECMLDVNLEQVVGAYPANKSIWRLGQKG